MPDLTNAYLSELRHRIISNRHEQENLMLESMFTSHALRHSGYSVAEIALELGVTRQTVYTYLRKYTEFDQDNSLSQDLHAL